MSITLIHVYLLFSFFLMLHFETRMKKRKQRKGRSRRIKANEILSLKMHWYVFHLFISTFQNLFAEIKKQKKKKRMKEEEKTLKRKYRMEDNASIHPLIA